MSMRSALAGAVTTVAIVAALGSPAAVEAGREADSRTVGRTLTAFADWDVGGLPGDAVAVVVVRLAVALVLVTGLCAVAGRARSRSAAFLAGWGALVLATAIAGAAAYVYEVERVLDGATFEATLADRIATAANEAAAFGLWTGWLVGLAVALATRPVVATDVAHDAGARTATPPNTRRIAEPPPPWWAPTPAGIGDGGMRPGPTVFLPGGGQRTEDDGGPHAAAARRWTPPPVVPEATYEMTTVSGDPHPSDPDATRPIGLPPDTGTSRGDGSEVAGASHPDADATTPMATRSEGAGAPRSDATTPMATADGAETPRPAPGTDT